MRKNVPASSANDSHKSKIYDIMSPAGANRKLMAFAGISELFTILYAQTKQIPESIQIKVKQR